MRVESKYLNKFEKVKDSKYKLEGNRMLVELLPKKEIKTASGLVLSAPSNYKATSDSFRALIGVVLMTGTGYQDDDGDSIPMETQVGNIVLINEFGTKIYSEFPGLNDYTQNTIAMTQESEIQLKFDSIADFEEYEKLLNQ